jgi:hypothetical protein
MRVRAVDANNLVNYIEGTIASYNRGDMTISVDVISGSGTYSEWNIAVLASIFVDDPQWGTSLYTDINTWNPIFSTPGLYADTWIIENNIGQFGPTINYFRLESNLQGALWDVPRHHFKCDVWPENIPFASQNYTNPSMDMMVGVTPYIKNMVNPASYQVFQTLMSTMYVELIEIWFYVHETQGPLDPPVNVSFSSPIVFTEQVFNFFWGKIPPTIFSQPGEYRLKFRVRTDKGAPTMAGSQYHDFWKTTYVNRASNSISDPIAQCYKNAIDTYGSLSQCAYFLQYDDASQNFTHLAKGSASDFLEPRDKEALYDVSQIRVLNLGTLTKIGATSEIETESAISDHFAPLVISDGVHQRPSEPIRGFGVDGSVIRDFTVEGNIIKLQTPATQFTQVLYGYYGAPSAFGKVEVIFRDESKAVVSGGNYVMNIPNISYNNNFNMVFIQDKSALTTRLVVPPDKYSVNTLLKTLSINQVWLQSVIAQTAGNYYFRIQLHASIDANNEDPIVVRSHTTFLSQNDVQLPGRPRLSRFPEMIFRSGKPQFRHFDYGLFFQGTSNTSVTIDTDVKIFTTQANIPFYQGARIVCYTTNGDYMKGRILSYSGSTIKVDVDEAFGTGNVYTSWFLYMLDIDFSSIDFYFTAAFGESIYIIYDAEV